MTHARKVLVGMVGALVAGAGAIAAADTPEATANPYQGVVDRNVFALKPPPPPPDPESVKPPTPDFALTGIMTLGGKRALFKSTPKPGKGADPAAKEHSYILAEGQRDGEVQVEQIDELAKTVTLTYDGTALKLDFTNNAAKAVAAAPALPVGAAAGARGAPPAKFGAGAPAAQPAGLRQPAAPGTNNRRPIRGGGTAMGPGPMGIGAYPGQSAVASQDAPVSREQQEVLMEAMRESNPSLPPLPPTSLTPLIEAEKTAVAPGAPGANPGGPNAGFAPPGPPLPPGPARPF